MGKQAGEERLKQAKTEKRKVLIEMKLAVIAPWLSAQQWEMLLLFLSYHATSGEAMCCTEMREKHKSIFI